MTLAQTQVKMAVANSMGLDPTAKAGAYTCSHVRSD
jgi:hypothetical protein